MYKSPVIRMFTDVLFLLSFFLLKIGDLCPIKLSKPRFPATHLCEFTPLVMDTSMKVPECLILWSHRLI